MTPEQIPQRKKEIETLYGPWVGHNYWLNDAGYAVNVEWGPNQRMRRMVQTVADLAGKPLTELRVLDLACLEGGFALEFALHGAQVLGLEGREANLARARFAAEVYGATGLEFVQDDVRNLRPETYGTFDVVLCLGILYHLDAADLFPFMEQVAAVCDRLTLVDTHVSSMDHESTEWKDKTYWGIRTAEHLPGATEDEKLGAVMDSLDNDYSFCLTKPSLCNLFRELGYSSVYECLNPFRKDLENYTTFAAVKGNRIAIHTSPMTEDAPEEEWSEKPEENLLVPPEEFHFPGKPLEWGKAAAPEPAAHEWRGRCEELEARQAEQAARLTALEAQHLPFTSLGGTLRQIPRMALRAIRRRLTGEAKR